MKLSQFTLSLLSVLALGACSSSSGGDGLFDEARALSLKVGVDLENLNIETDIDVDDLPTSAEMRGVFVIVPLDDEGSRPDLPVFGRATATADFRAGSLRGAASGFRGYELNEICEPSPEQCTARSTGSWDGSLMITGLIEEIEFDYEVSGRLSGRIDGEDVTIDAEGDGQGVFGLIDDRLTAFGEGEGAGTLEGSTETIGFDHIMILQE